MYAIPPLLLFLWRTLQPYTLTTLLFPHEPVLTEGPRYAFFLSYLSSIRPPGQMSRKWDRGRRGPIKPPKEATGPSLFFPLSLLSRTYNTIKQTAQEQHWKTLWNSIHMQIYFFDKKVLLIKKWKSLSTEKLCLCLILFKFMLKEKSFVLFNKNFLEWALQELMF